MKVGFHLLITNLWKQTKYRHVVLLIEQKNLKEDDAMGSGPISISALISCHSGTFALRFVYNFQLGNYRTGNYSILILTDGSKMEKEVGKGVYSEDLQLMQSYRLPDDACG